MRGTTVSPTRTTVPDLLGITLMHRLMRTDLHRLTDAAERIATGDAPCSDRRAAALTGWVLLLCDEIHHHHRAEDEIAWPVIARFAASSVDLAVLSDDHSVLDPLLDLVRASADGFAATTGNDARRVAAAGLQQNLARIRDEIDEHLDAEEASLFPVIEAHVPVAEWEQVDEQVRRGGPGMRFTLPRMAGVATPDEWARLRAAAGPVLGVLIALMRPAHRRRERLVFG
ncbi:hemerythrin domain-containing protein [Pseudonocardia sp. GCM10023141]|uniref:hemerythrin domain-containing protein n=1 Tax=Pseudonocardia sp. GCM10023141 TaxID=3252653 RepID=UPI00360C5639